MLPKFRAWHIHKQIMCEVIRIDFKQGIVTLDLEPDDDEYYWTETDWKTSHVILMQSTGLKDRNGVEIYEGDIIEWRYVITYVDSSQQGNLGMSIGFYAQRDDFESYHTLDVGDEYEVLGNIYENKKLLEVE